MDHIQEDNMYLQEETCNLSKLPPEMLEKILCFCTINDLKSCRLVNKYWRYSVLNLWQTLTWVKMDYVQGNRVKSICGYLNLLDGDANQELESYRQYTNFSMNLSISDEDSASFQKFFQRCGTQIKMLKLEHCVFPNLNIFRETIFRECPNLEYLLLTGSRARAVDATEATQKEDEPEEEPKFDPNENLKSVEFHECRMYHEYTTVSWTDIFEHFPKIKSLNLKCSAEKMDEIFDTVKKVRDKFPNKLKLEHVFTEDDGPYLSSYIPDTLLEVLRDPNIKLRDLSLTVAGNDGEAELHEILLLHGATLKSLELRSDGVINTQDCFPVQFHGLFKNLTKLKMHGMVFGDLACLELMPFLKKLILLKYSLNDSLRFMASSNIKLRNCTEFETDYYLIPEKLAEVIKWMPHLKRLKMPLKNDTFELVCKKWQRLEAIDISESWVDECGLTGLDTEDVNAINRFKLKNMKSHSTAPRANVTSLTQLRSFFMRKHYRLQESTYHLRYASAFFAFRQAPSLKKVAVQDYQVDEEIWELVPGTSSTKIYTLRSHT